MRIARPGRESEHIDGVVALAMAVDRALGAEASPSRCGCSDGSSPKKRCPLRVGASGSVRVLTAQRSTSRLCPEAYAWTHLASPDDVLVGTAVDFPPPPQPEATPASASMTRAGMIEADRIGGIIYRSASGLQAGLS